MALIYMVPIIGEKLIIKMWDSLVDRGMGALLKPWQIRREASAQLETRRDELLMLAQTEKDVLAIQKGQKRIAYEGKELRLLTNDAQLTDGRAEPQLNIVALLGQADSRRQANALLGEINTAKTILQAEEILKGETTPLSAKDIEPDWLYRWRDFAAQVSDEDMQSLWAKVLAGEVTSPGTHSFRTLDFLKNLTRAEGQQIQQLCPYVIDDTFIVKYGQMTEDGQHNLDHSLMMQELGIISGVSSGLTLTYAPDAGALPAFQFRTLGRVVFARSLEADKKLVMQMYRLTPIGREVLSLNPMPAPAEYLQAFGDAIKDQGFSASVANAKPDPKDPGRLYITQEVGL